MFIPVGRQRRRAMRTWIFQGNPDELDLNAYLATAPIQLLWLVTRYGDEISVGDRVYIWRTQGDGMPGAPWASELVRWAQYIRCCEHC
jgi:hypothetical protein